MKVDLQLLTKNHNHTLNFFEASLKAKEIDQLELLDVLIFPIELVYSVKQILAAVHLALDNLADDVSMLEFKQAVSSLFYNKKKAFRSYYDKYVVVFLDSNPNFKGKGSWDGQLRNMKSHKYCDMEQLRKTYGITDRQLEVNEEYDEHILTTLNLQAVKLFN